MKGNGVRPIAGPVPSLTSEIFQAARAGRGRRRLRRSSEEERGYGGLAPLDPRGPRERELVKEHEVNMSGAGARYQVEPGYVVELPPGDHLILVAGGRVGNLSPRFNDREKAIARRATVWEVKHYGVGGRKWWTRHIGVEFYFAVAKERIDLLPEKGYSYVPILIGGEKFSLNVSGGGGDVWTDCVRPICHTSINMPARSLRVLASAAMTVEEASRAGVRLTLSPLADYQVLDFRHAAAKVTVVSRWGVGARAVLGESYKIGEGHGPFKIESIDPRRRRIVCETPFGPYRIRFSQLDWPATAEANGLGVPEPQQVLRVSPEAA